MSDLAALAYVSSAVTDFSESDLEALLQTARDENARGELTGVLLYHDRTFFQYLEGPERELQLAYQRIKNSRKHRGIIQLFLRQTPNREFNGWRMGFARAPRSLILQLSNMEWTEIASAGAENSERPVGMTLLLEFWRTSTR
ncbi:MAG: BLUF domain-containing protein [Rubrivivax sp.]|nr:BLUF domain-containing protein [Rubrivivax sp.]